MHGRHFSQSGATSALPWMRPVAKVATVSSIVPIGHLRVNMLRTLGLVTL